MFVVLAWRLLMLVTTAAAAEQANFDDPSVQCSACVVTVAELLDSVADEKPSMNVETKMRMDEKGRQSTILDYRVSEIRATELLEGLCIRMRDYHLLADSMRQSGEVVREKGYLQKLGSVRMDELIKIAPPTLDVLAEGGVEVHQVCAL